MKALLKAVLMSAALISMGFLTGCSGLANREEGSRCEEIAARGQISILTLNLLFSETEARAARLADLASFIAQNQVDILLLQEVVGGTQVGTRNSAMDLKGLLATRHGLDYNVNSVLETQPPNRVAVGNAIISTCEMPFVLAKHLPQASEVEFRGETIKLGRDLLTARIEIPELGSIRVYNAHLCAACSVAQRQKQLGELLAYVNELENRIPGENPIVLGGDFNISLLRGDGGEKLLYRKIIDAGFTDAHAAVNGAAATLCAQPRAPDEHCTLGVSNLGGSDARRSDYIFSRGFASVSDSRVVFNTAITDEPTVSNHAAVLSRLVLP